MPKFLRMPSLGRGRLLPVCYGVLRRSACALPLFAAIAPSLAVFACWTIDRAALERRMTRFEARSEIADERRLVARTDLAGVEHRLAEVETRGECIESVGPHVGAQG